MAENTYDQSTGMAVNAMGTLQSNLDDVHAGAAVASKAGNTDTIRIMLREQKRECSELHANPIFREFRDEQKKCVMAAGQQQGTREQPPVIDDLEAGENPKCCGMHSKNTSAATPDDTKSFQEPYTTFTPQLCASSAHR